jgi:hypothetical protein
MVEIHEVPSHLIPVLAASVEAAGSVMAAAVEKGFFHTLNTDEMGRHIAAIAASTLKHLSPSVTPKAPE